MEYVVFSPEYLYHMANMIRANVGSIFSVSLHLFLAVLSIYIMVHLIDFIGQ